MEVLFLPELRPFAVAAAILFGLIGIELVALVLGLSLSQVIDKSLHHHDGTGLLGWLNVGGVPLLILLILLLGSFAASGLIVQSLAFALAGARLPALLAALPALAAAIPITRGGSRLVARVVPRDETYAVEAADLVGRIATVTVGPLDAGLPGQARLKDEHGNWHVVRARAARDTPAMAAGSQILLIDLDQGIYLAMPAPAELAPNH